MMKRRFGRGRKAHAAKTKGAQIDAARCFERIASERIVDADVLSPVPSDEIPEHFAAVAEGRSDQGRELIVAFAPRNGADAALAGLAHARLRADAGRFDGEVIAVCPEWSIAARRRLALLTPRDIAFRALTAASLSERDGSVEVPSGDARARVPARRVADRVDGAARDLFLRALAALEGLAAKHGGAVRGAGERVDLVLLARRVASLRIDEAPYASSRLVLETLLPDRDEESLDNQNLSVAMDRLEGNLRKRLNDKRVRSGEEGLRAQLVSALLAAEQIRASALWPLADSDPEVVDAVGVAADGAAVVAALRAKLALPELAAILDAVVEVRSALPAWLAAAEPPVRLDALRLLLAAEEFGAGASALLPMLAIDQRSYEIRDARGRAPQLRARDARRTSELPRGSEPPRASELARASALPRTSELERAPERARAPYSELEDSEESPLPASEPRDGRREGRRRRRGQRGGAGREPREGEDSRGAGREPRGGEDVRGAGRGAREGAGSRGAFGRSATADERHEPEASAHRYEEISIFDLDETPDAEVGAPRVRRGRRRGRRGRSGGGDTPSGRDGSGTRADAPARGALEDDAGPRSQRGREARGPSARDAARSSRDAARSPRAERFDDDEADDDLADLLLAPISDVDEPSLEAPLAYEEDADALGLPDTPEPSGAPAEPAGDAGVAESESILRRTRRRAAFVVHADRRSLIAALLLARDLRLIEGIWVYPQSELMTFFRSVATDLHEQTPICVIGFTASPARDTIQAASLYSDRLAWFDHHDWPPEDLDSLRAAIGEANLVVKSGTESSIPAVLTQRNRRSRFSDKIVELATGRFSQHDYERWGRVWWERLGAAAAKPGDRRADIEPLIVGRPSDLAREAADAATPPPPPEVAFVAERDFRLVHFGGYQMVVVPTPPELDMHLAARIARERYGSQLSVAHYEGDAIFVLAADESPGRRDLDLAAMVVHLASKHDWIEATSSEDHVARIRIRDFATHPERMDDVIGEIAMGRSILEG